MDWWEMCSKTHPIIGHRPRKSNKHSNRTNPFFIPIFAVNARFTHTKWSLWDVGKYGSASEEGRPQATRYSLRFWKKNVLHLPILQEELKIKNQTQCLICEQNPHAQTTYTRPIKTLSGERESNVATSHPTAAELRGIPTCIKHPEKVLQNTRFNQQRKRLIPE